MPILNFRYDPSALNEGDPVSHVYFYCAPVHDHHAPQLPVMTQRADGTFHASVDIPSDAMGSFLVAPVDAEVARKMRELSRGTPGDTQARWHELLAHSVAPNVCRTVVSIDPPGVFVESSMSTESGRVSMPDAPPRPGWPEGLTQFPHGEGWKMEVLAGKTAWTAGSSDSSHLLILFDAAMWLDTGLPQVLAEMAASMMIPNIRVIAIDTREDRSRILGCSEDFAQWVARDLLRCLPSRPAHCVAVAGQSLGGLTAANIVRLHPNRIARAIANSPSFWWPTFGGRAGGRMAELCRDSETLHCLRSTDAEFFFSVGRGEGGGGGVGMVEHAGAVASVLSGAGVECAVEVTNTAHEMAAWEGALTRGTMHMWGEPRDYGLTV